MTASTSDQPDVWFARSPEAVAEALGVDPTTGLSSSEVAQRRERYGSNTIPAERGPSLWQIALRLLVDPMNIMLIAVTVVSCFINQIPVAVMVGLLVVVNVVMGARQEMSARAAVDALSDLQIPHARVVRDGSTQEIPASELVPGDIVLLEAGDLVPADARILRAARLEAQEAALTGESAPVDKGVDAVADTDATLGDRSSMVFQNTQITRGTATVVVTDTGAATQMGRIAELLAAVEPTLSPLQRELRSLTKVLALIAWGAVAIIVVIGVARQQPFEALLLLGISMAISAIPSGMPTFVQGMLAYGAKMLADHRAVVKNLADVETLGATSAINSDKTGTLTLNEMTVQKLYFAHEWFTVSGGGYSKQGEIRGAAGTTVPDFTALAYGLCLCSDATVSDTGTVIGDPTEAALIVLAAKLGVDAELTRREYPRVAEVPFDSEYKFMATFHHAPVRGEERLLSVVKGGVDVVLARCSQAMTADGTHVDIEEERARIEQAQRELSEQGLRVLAFAFRADDALEAAMTANPMSAVEDLVFVGMVGIIDPLRPSSVDAVRTAHEAGIEVRMITGDHAITAAAIGAQLDLGPGAASGSDLRTMSDAELSAQLPNIHVFGRVTPEDKLRIARLMQESGDIVAMTGDAVNDAAALKQADVGVAMGSGSEVTKQAGNMILTDDNFGTLITAITVGRSIYEKIVSYARFQMSLLFSLVILFLTASIFNINEGVPMTPLMVLFLNFFTTMFPVIVILLDPVPDDIMSRPPRDPKVTLSHPGAVLQWLLFGAVIAATTITPLLTRADELHGEQPSVPVTMAFAVASFGAILGGLAMRRSPGSGFVSPIANALKWLAIPAVMTVACVELGFLQRLIGTVSLSGSEWLTVLALAVIVPLVVEAQKALLRRTASVR
ncbi:cation-translocating P-type ATPase [Microbacterium keratanolyticum]